MAVPVLMSTIALHTLTISTSITLRLTAGWVPAQRWSEGFGQLWSQKFMKPWPCWNLGSITLQFLDTLKVQLPVCNLSAAMGQPLGYYSNHSSTSVNNYPHSTLASDHHQRLELVVCSRQWKGLETRVASVVKLWGVWKMKLYVLLSHPLSWDSDV